MRKNALINLPNKMPDDLQISMDDDIVQAYLAFKRRDFEGCLRILEENIVFRFLAFLYVE